jgi:hypothetical protein
MRRRELIKLLGAAAAYPLAATTWPPAARAQRTAMPVIGFLDPRSGRCDGWRLRPLIAFQTRGVFTNTTPVDAYRGAGKPEANYLIERCIDIAAAELGMDALKLRRKNIFRRFRIWTAG